MRRESAEVLLSTTFSAYTRRNHKGDLYGIELENECEDYLLDEEYGFLNNLNFRVTEDPSLRGNGYELVSFPMKPVELKENLMKLCPRMKNYNWTYSRRTSTHIHVNFADKTVLDVLKYLLVYYTLEPVLFLSVKPTRLSNTFCMPSEDVLNQVINSVSQDYSLRFLADENTYKYSSLNIAPLYRFGTVECRIFHSTFEYKELAIWLNTLHAMKKFSEGFDSLSAMKKDFIDTPAEDYLEKVLGNQLWKHYIQLAANANENLAELIRSGYAYARRLVTLDKTFDKAREVLSKPAPAVDLNIYYDQGKVLWDNDQMRPVRLRVGNPAAAFVGQALAAAIIDEMVVNVDDDVLNQLIEDNA